MRVLLVCNNAFLPGNGVCTAVLSLSRRLKKKGVESRIMSCANPNPLGIQPDYPLKHFKFPLFEPLISASGFMYAKYDEEVAADAIAWADVVHLHEGFPMEAKVARLARKMGKPCVGTFHLFTENIMANLGFKRARLLNFLVTRWWRNSVYNHCTHVHCPTEIVKKHLLKCGFKSEMSVITNGMDIVDSNIAPYDPSGDPIEIVCVGRFAHEKSQNTLLKAMNYSKYAHRIHLHFAGKGPCQKRYERQAQRLLAKGVINHAPKFGFYNIDELRERLRRAYLYIHCAYIEVEGLSCAEAIREGVVPIIAEGEFTATSQFALDQRSIFPVFDSQTLAERIDWWIEHPEERVEMGLKYAKSITKYNADDAIRQMIQMYEDSINQC